MLRMASCTWRKKSHRDPLRSSKFRGADAQDQLGYSHQCKAQVAQVAQVQAVQKHLHFAIVASVPIPESAGVAAYSPVLIPESHSASVSRQVEFREAQAVSPSLGQSLPPPQPPPRPKWRRLVGACCSLSIPTDIRRPGSMHQESRRLRRVRSLSHSV